MALLEPVVDAAPLSCRREGAALTESAVEPEVTTVADDMAVVFHGAQPRVYSGLRPATEYTYDGVTFRTLERPPGERLSTIATVNDVHFGETVCGYDSNNPDGGPVFRSEEGEPPYPEIMNGAVVAEISAAAPDLVVAKGDLTDDGDDHDYQRFLEVYGGAFGDRLMHIRGNHDAYRGQTFADFGPQAASLPGVVTALIDTTVPRRANGAFPADQAEWLDAVAEDAARANLPVLVFGHHHVWSPDSRVRPEGYYGIVPDDSERLVGLFVRHPGLAGYFAGHTHRNRVRRISATGDRPWVEVACVKDFPGAWAEYRVFTGGVLQVVHRALDPAAVAWADRTRGMFGGLYPQFSFGSLEDRCFRVL